MKMTTAMVMKAMKVICQLIIQAVHQLRVGSSSLDSSGLDTLQGELPVNEQQAVDGRCLRPRKCVLTVAVQPPKKKRRIADGRECEHKGESQKEGGDGDQGQHGQNGDQECGQGRGCGQRRSRRCGRGQRGGRGRGRGQRGGRGCGQGQCGGRGRGQGQRDGRGRGRGQCGGSTHFGRGGSHDKGKAKRPTEKDSVQKWMTFVHFMSPGLTCIPNDDVCALSLFELFFDDWAMVALSCF